MDSNLIVLQFEKLKQYGMAEAAGDLLALPVQMRPSLETVLTKLIETEVRHRDDKRTARLVKGAKLACKPLIEDVKCGPARNLNRETLLAIADCGFIRRGENLLIIAKTGCGKTYLANAIGYQACRLGLKVLYLSMNHFVHQLKSANTQGITEEFFEKLNKYDLLIYDDFALHPIDESTRLALLTLLDDRYEKKSVIITSQLPYDKWYDYIGQTTVADAILDRIQHSSHLIRLEGQSMREQKEALNAKSGALVTTVKDISASALREHLLTTLTTLHGYWYHVTAMSGTIQPLHMVPQKCYSGTERVILSILSHPNSFS